MRKMSVLVFMALLTAGCSSIDCPLNSIISAKYMVHSDTDTLHDTLSVVALRLDGTATLLNKDVNITNFSIPVSYGNAFDRMQLMLTDKNHVTLTDTVTLYKTDTPHFESVDCSPAFFHTITNVEWTRNAIDTIIISKPSVTYDTRDENIHIHFKSGH